MPRKFHSLKFQLQVSAIMLNHLKLRQKVTILLLIILVAGLSLSGFGLSYVLRQNAIDEIASKSLALIETMSAVRQYTITHITPELSDELETKFLPQTVSAFSAREVFDIVRKKTEYQDFFYKEAALNPTNLRDKADIFETKIIERFINEKDLKQVSGFRSLQSGDVFYVARPLAVDNKSCLVCHSTPERAPKTMIQRYGTTGGFNWKLHEIIGAQIVSLPSSKVIEKANQTSFLNMFIVSIVFIAAIILVNIFLHRQVVRPLKRITRVAEEVSTGHMDVEFEQFSHDEIGNLAKAFQRMKFSLEMAMRRLKKPQEYSGN
jgi:HAMP domain-containing protein